MAGPKSKGAVIIVVEARKLLDTLPADAPFCFGDGQNIYEVTEIRVVPVIDEGEHFGPTEDRAADGVVEVAVAV